MRRLIAAIGGVAFGSLLLVATVAAADPTPTPSTTVQHGDTVAAVLGLTPAQVAALRHDGLSLAQIAERQKVEVQKVVDALVARWSDRIESRLKSGALTAAEAIQLKAQLQARARAFVNSTAPGGMQGATVGNSAGNGDANSAANGAGNGDATRARDGSGTGAGAGDGTCDGTGGNGAGRR